jgi:hypothetical protein
MPTKRRKLTARSIGISAAAVQAWQRGDLHACHQALGIMPFDFSPFDVPTEYPACYATGWGGGRGPGDAMNYDSWRRALELRQALIELAGEPGPMDRHGGPLGPAPPRKVTA